jgi:protein-tyrosine-phosphatase
LKNDLATTDTFKYQLAAPATIQDINYANVVITMTNSHRNRILALIDRECLASNLDTRLLSSSSRAHWN